MSSQHSSIVSALEHLALDKPDKPAFIFVNQSLDRLVLTRQQVWDYSRKYATVLKRMGLGKGHVVLNTLPNSPQGLIAQLGTITAGAISMSGQTCMADGSDLILSLNRGQADGVILDPMEPGGVFDSLKSKLEILDTDSGECFCPEAPNLKYILMHPSGSKTQYTCLEVLDKEREMTQEDVALDDVCQYISTSGSTGVIKLVPVTSRILLEIGTQLSKAFGCREGDVFMNNGDFGWVAGCPSVYYVVGCPRVLIDASQGVPENLSEFCWRMATQEKCTICWAVPSFLIEFSLARKTIEDLDFEAKNNKIRTIVSGGAPITKRHVLAALGNFCDELVFIYGSSEGGIHTSMTVTDPDGYEDFNMGSPASGVKIRIINKDGKEVPIGEKGQILIQSNQSGGFYVNDPLSTSETFWSDGWIHLGDVGMMDSQGHLFVMGRDKFAIMKGTIAIYPEVIEPTIQACPGVKAAVVTGVPDEKTFEEICALVIKQPEVFISADDVQRFCENTFNFKEDYENVSTVPKYYLFVDSFPMTRTSKLNRNKIKKLACEMLKISCTAYSQSVER